MFPEISLPIKSPVAPAVFWIAFFEVILSASVADCLTRSKGFWLYLPIKFVVMHLAKDKNPQTFTNIYISLGRTNMRHFLYVIL